jgi:hypothetical protein
MSNYYLGFQVTGTFLLDDGTQVAKHEGDPHQMIVCNRIPCIYLVLNMCLMS